MAHVSILSNSSNVTISSNAYTPHYLGAATYIGTTTYADGEAQIYGFSEPCWQYRVSSPWPPLPFVALGSSGYSVRSIVKSGTNQWDILLAKAAGLSGSPPTVFCFGRLSSFAAGGPHFRLSDDSGNPVFDSRSTPIRVKGVLDVPAYTPPSRTSTLSVAMPSGMTLPAVYVGAAGHFHVSTPVGALWRISEYRAYWTASGSNLVKVLSYVANWGSLEDGTVVGGSMAAQTIPIIDVYGL